MDLRVDELGVQRFKNARRRAFAFRYESDLVYKLALAVGCAALTGLAAQVSVPVAQIYGRLGVPLPFTPVPVTLQTFAVLLSGVALGKRYGALSQGIYGGAGAAGVPWFAGWSGGPGVLLGPTGGYVVGFVVAAAVVGWAVDRTTKARSLPAVFAILFVANFVVIYAFGLAGLGAFVAISTGSIPTASSVFVKGMLPFIPGDVVKLVFAGLVGAAVTPDVEFGPESL